MVHYSDLNDFQLKQIILDGGAVEVKRKNHDTGEMIKEYYLTCKYVIVSEAGASIYSA